MIDKKSAKATQAEKFKKLAREIGADEDEKAFKAKLKKLVKGKPEGKKDDTDC